MMAIMCKRNLINEIDICDVPVLHDHVHIVRSTHGHISKEILSKYETLNPLEYKDPVAEDNVRIIVKVFEKKK